MKIRWYTNSRMPIINASELTPAPATPASASVEEGTIVQTEEFDMMAVTMAMMFLLFDVVKTAS